MKTTTEVGWVPSIGRLAIKVGKDRTEEIPVFQWQYTDGQFVGYDLRAWPHLGEFTVAERRDPDMAIRDNYRAVVAVIRKMHNLEPPSYMSEVWNDIKKTSKLAKAGNASEFLRACAETENRWQSYISAQADSR